ncbi:unnamed protein product [Meloidogyne enterolobii]|uniref:Uncharacterized protein n=1 Tax=Meloidogyne enterolobii TaxID=390850 RepID=A0ACB0Y501_MELEN
MFLQLCLFKFLFFCFCPNMFIHKQVCLGFFTTCFYNLFLQHVFTTCFYNLFFLFLQTTCFTTYLNLFLQQVGFMTSWFFPNLFLSISTTNKVACSFKLFLQLFYNFVFLCTFCTVSAIIFCLIS